VLTDHAEVRGGVLGADAAIIFTKGDIQHPVQLVLDRPVTAHGLQRFDRRQLSVRTGARDMVLAVALFPVIAPALLSGVVATRELLGGAPMQALWSWITILSAFDIAFLTAGAMLFETLVRD
jgi:hypothetical protein